MAAGRSKYKPREGFRPLFSGLIVTRSSAAAVDLVANGLSSEDLMTGSGKIVTISGVDRCWSSTRTHAGRYLSLKAAV
ncbi:hypothetical protein J2W52_005304 [Rhizobium miluonense]|uniref:Uncharacterized protein n=1 Tax=Rhizobium miluonense TaxID=411945 RepID=A0ABU1SXH1_9HYPH|nr:hypothetical protein [Rhizobium miluonense]